MIDEVVHALRLGAGADGSKETTAAPRSTAAAPAAPAEGDAGSSPVAPAGTATAADPVAAEPAPAKAPAKAPAPAPAKAEAVPAPSQAVAAEPVSTTSLASQPGPLSWAPPAGYTSYPVKEVTATNASTTVSGRGGDVLIKLSREHPVGPIVITDCRNAVVIGGEIRALPSAKVDGHDQRAIYVRNCTGTVHIEGVRIDGAVSGAQSDGIAVNAPKAVVQIQNVRVDGLRGTSSGNHADVFQPWGGVREFRIDRLSGSSNFQGLHIFENLGEIGGGIIRNTNIAGTDVPTDKGGYFLWTDCEDDYPLVLDDVYVAPRPGRPFSQSVWPSVTHKECPSKVSSGVATWPRDTSISGQVREGRPATGDFVPAGSVGRGYTSPGHL